MRTTSSTSCRRSPAVSTSGTRPPSRVGVGTLAVLLLLPRVISKIPAVLVAVVGATVVTALFELDIPTVGALPEGLPGPTLPVDRRRGRRARCWSPPLGITLVSLTDTIATSSSFAARRGDEVDPNQEMVGIGAANIGVRPVPGLRGVDQRFTHGRGRTGGRQEPGDGAGRCRDRGAAARRRSRRCSPTFPRRRSPPSSSRPRCRSPTSARSRRFWRVRKSSLVLSLAGDRRRHLLRRARGHPHGHRALRRAVLPAQLVAPGRAAGAVRRRLAQPARPERGGGPELGGDRVPVGGPAVLRQRGHVPAAAPPPHPRATSRVGSCSSARRSPTSTSPRPRCSNGSTSS